MSNFTTPDYTQTPDRRTPNFSYAIDPENITPEISIITPFHNTGELFLQTVSCVLQQSFQNFEWIIVDDLSTDERSLRLLADLSARDARVRVLRNVENLGPGGSRNAGISNAKGNFLFFVDSDDLVEPTILEKYWIFLKINEEFSFCTAWHIGFGAQQYLWKNGFEHGRMMLENNVIQPTFMARRSLFDQVRFDESIRHGFEDWDFWLQCASRGKWGYTVPEFLFWYRRVQNISDKWKDWDSGERMNKFRAKLKEKYHQKFQHSFPDPRLTHFARGVDATRPVFANRKINPLRKGSKKRLIFIIPWMALGGADKFNLDVLEGLTAKGWEITIVTTQRSENAWHSEFARFTSDIFILHNYAKEAFYTHILDHLISSRDPDCILFSNSEIGHYLSPYIKYNFPSIPLVDYNHMEEEYWNDGGHPKQSVIHQSIFDRNIVSSKHLKNWMVAKGADKDKIEIVYTSSDYNKLTRNESTRSSVRQRLGLDPNTCLIVFAGRLTHQKQPYVLLNAMLHLSRKRKSGYILAIAGDGPESWTMKEWTSSNKLDDKIRYLGALSHRENIELLQAADIFFLPSLWEGISLAIYEAMSLGLPIVSADVGGQKELVSPENGFLVTRSSPEDEAGQYALILEELVGDPEKRRLQGLMSRNIIEAGFGIEMMVAGMDTILTKCIAEATTFQPEGFNGLLRQNYALFIFERNLADELWHSNIRLRSDMAKHETRVVATTGQQPAASPKPGTDGSWYYENYEVLPMWYKKFGQILKIFTGKRDWRSLYSSRYKPNPNELSHMAWYALEYDALPGWYKKFGKKLKSSIDAKNAHRDDR